MRAGPRVGEGRRGPDIEVHCDHYTAVTTSANPWRALACHNALLRVRRSGGTAAKLLGGALCPCCRYRNASGGNFVPTCEQHSKISREVTGRSCLIKGKLAMACERCSKRGSVTQGYKERLPRGEAALGIVAGGRSDYSADIS